MAYQQYDLALTSLVKTGILTECYIPLWVYSSSYSASTNVPTTSGGVFLQKGSTTPSSKSSATNLHTLSSNWSPNQKFAFEASITSGSATAYFALWDMTSNTIVSASQISVFSTSMNLTRSGQFTLTPGHTYGITVWGQTINVGDLSKASLVAFLS